MKTTGALYGIVAVFLLVLASTSASSASDWPTFKQNFQRTGYQAGASNFSLADLDVIWNYSAGSPVKSSPAIANINGDQDLEIIFGADDKKLHALDYKGNTLWTYEADARIRSSPTIADLEGDNKTEIIFGTDNGTLYVLDNQGELLWTHQTNGSIETSPLAYNFDGTPEKEVIVTSKDGFVYAINHHGEQKWAYETSESIRSSPSVADVNRDKEAEIVFGSDDNLVYILSFPPAAGTWQYQTNGDVAASPVAADYDGDGTVEVLSASTDSFVRPIYYTYSTSRENQTECKVVGFEYVCGKPTVGFSRFMEEWNYSTGSAIYSSPSIASFIGSRKDIVFGTDGKTLHIINYKGRRVGGYTTNKAIRTSPAIADFDGDKIPEIVFGADDGGIYVIDYPYLFTLYTTEGTTTKSDKVYSALVKLGGLAEEIAGKMGKDASITAGEENEWSITKTVNGRAHDQGSIRYSDATQRMEIQYGASKVTFDARNTGTTIDVYNYPNKKKYYFETQGPVRSSPAIADINGDGNLEFAAGSDDGTLYVFGSKKEFIREEAGRLLAKAEEAYARGYTESVSNYVEGARRLHEQIDDAEGLARDNMLAKRIEADGLREKAAELYDQGFVANATEYLTRAQLIYASINYTLYGDQTGSLSDLLEAELYFREASVLYDSGDLENASRYALKASELFLAHNDSLSANRSKDLYEKSMEHLDGDSYYVQALNTFFEEGYCDNVTEYLLKARLIYADVNAQDSIILVDEMLARTNATRLLDEALLLEEAGNVTGARELVLQARQLFESVNYTPGIYRAENILNGSETQVSAARMFEHAKNLYAAGLLPEAIDYAKRAGDAYLEINDTAKASEAERFANNAIEEYRQTQKPRYLTIAFNILAGIFAGSMLILSVEKILKDKKKKRERQLIEDVREDVI
ncbi:MAG: PQQ-binding-like beta-propeller repeat protein [Candidatus Altiarchaeota archaeon]